MTSVGPSSLYTKDRKTLCGNGTCKENNLEEEDPVRGQGGSGETLAPALKQAARPYSARDRRSGGKSSTLAQLPRGQILLQAGGVVRTHLLAVWGITLRNRNKGASRTGNRGVAQGWF